MATLKTSEIAALTGIHPNTVRLYEELELIPKPQRKPNGYRIYTDFHVEQIQLARLAFQIEIIQNGLRKKVVRLVKLSAARDFTAALSLAQEYLEQIKLETIHAEEAIEIVKQILTVRDILSQNPSVIEAKDLTYRNRKEVSDLLNISMDSLRNWEMNGLLSVKRKENGYRVYTEEDIRRLKIIRSLRYANYSLESILRLLNELSINPEADIRLILNTPKPDTDIITVCDQLILSLIEAEKNINIIIHKLNFMKTEF